MLRNRFALTFTKINFMVIPIRTNRFSNLLVVLAAFCIVCLCSCNGSSSSDEKKDTTSAGKDTGMKMSDSNKMTKDSAKITTDTTGRGGQPVPPKP